MRPNNETIEKLKAIYPHQSNESISAILGLTQGQIRGLITRLGLRKDQKYYRYQQKAKSHLYHYPKNNR